MVVDLILNPIQDNRMKRIYIAIMESFVTEILIHAIFILENSVQFAILALPWYTTIHQVDRIVKQLSRSPIPAPEKLRQTWKYDLKDTQKWKIQVDLKKSCSM